MMNHVYDPQVAAQIAAYVNYVTPVKGAQQVLEGDDPDVARDELIFPSPETLAKLHPYPNLSPEEEREAEEAFAAVTGA
jgi:spermidine/putrescine transport system substrate-binding protein